MNINSFIRQFTIRTRMMGTMAVVALGLIIVGGVGLVAQLHSNDVSMSFIDGEFAALKRINTLRSTMYQLRMSEKDMLIHYESRTNFGKAKAAWTKTFAQIETLGKELDESIKDPAQKAKVTDTMAQVGKFKARFVPVLAQLELQGFDSGSAATAFVTRAQVDYDGALASIDSL